jgi:hypothetical protein
MSTPDAFERLQFNSICAGLDQREAHVLPACWALPHSHVFQLAAKHSFGPVHDVFLSGSFDASGIMRLLPERNCAGLLTPKRGRRWSGLFDDEVRARWISAFKAWVPDIKNPDKKREHDDFDSELALRGIDMPLRRSSFVSRWG